MRVKGETILFVDDETILVDMSREFLEELGYRVVAENNPVHALETFRKNSGNFDIVITDKTMPHMTGFELIRQIRDIRNDIPAVLCTGLQEEGDMEKLTSLGISRIIAKPTRMSVLNNAIRNVLDKRLNV
jgi:CheY-like chemotaxis protein